MFSTNILLSGLRLDVDGTFFIQLLVLTVLFFVLKTLVFQPFLQSMDIREEKTVKARERAAAIDARSADLTAEMNEALAKAREEAQAARKELRLEGLEARESETKDARAQADATLREAQAALEGEVAEAQKQAASQVDVLARTLASKALGRSL